MIFGVGFGNIFGIYDVEINILYIFGNNIKLDG